jgi:hypothetical protein
MPRPFDSRKLWTTFMTLAAVMYLAHINQANGELIAAVVSIGGLGTAAQGFIDITRKPPTDAPPQ